MIVIVTENKKNIIQCSQVFIDENNRVIGVNSFGQNVVLGEYTDTRQAQHSLVRIATAIVSELPIYVMESQKQFPDSYLTEDINPFESIENVAKSFM